MNPGLVAAWAVSVTVVVVCAAIAILVIRSTIRTIKEGKQ